MIILSKMDYEGEHLQEDLKKLEKLDEKIQSELKSGKVEGPFFPQDASLLYIFHVDEYDWLNRSGRIWYREMAIIPASQNDKSIVRATMSTYHLSTGPMIVLSVCVANVTGKP
ncbi:MAG: hypothetical protein JRN52_11615 [Nitrososphaerota archaeon]|nr:hypothetical protein [Nitrososphaerota archaeon]